MDLFPETVRRQSSVRYLGARAQAPVVDQVAPIGFQPGIGRRTFSSSPWGGGVRSAPKRSG
jgi:hypothetical protein